jgi:hypothetical protein
LVLGAPLVLRNGGIRVAAQSQTTGTFRLTATIMGHSSLTNYGPSVAARGRRSAVLIVNPTARAQAALARYGRLRLKLTVDFRAAQGGGHTSLSELIAVTFHNVPRKLKNTRRAQ